MRADWNPIEGDGITSTIANLILVAPDMDLDVTRQRFASERFFQFVDRMTLYVSQSDRAIGQQQYGKERTAPVATSGPTMDRVGERLR